MLVLKENETYLKIGLPSRYVFLGFDEPPIGRPHSTENYIKARLDNYIVYNIPLKVILNYI